MKRYRVAQIKSDKLQHRKRRICLLFLLILLVLFSSLVGFVNRVVRGFEVYNEEKITKQFAAAGLPTPIQAEFPASPAENWGNWTGPEANESWKEWHYNGSARQDAYYMRYYISEDLSQNPEKPLLYLIHGSPGSAVNFMRKSYFLNEGLRQVFVLLAMDRPGYGASTPGQAEPEFERAAQPLLEQLYSLKREYPSRRIYGLGWSYGGPLIALLAERASHDAGLSPQRILDGVLIVATPADPQQEKFWWFNPLLEHRWLNWMFSSGINVANIEKMAHPAELEKLRSSWARIRIPTAYLQGTDDAIVLPQNIEFLRRQAVKAGVNSHVYEIPGGGHNIVFTQIELIERILRNWLD